MMQNYLMSSCFKLSYLAGEPMYGTAPRVDFWLIIELDENWTSNPLDGSKLPTGVKGWIKNKQDSTPALRVQYVKRKNNPQNGISVYLVDSREENPRIFEGELSSYSELLGLDLSSAFTGGNRGFSKTEEPLYLVCTHGAYDSCCGTNGYPVYESLEENQERGLGGRVWQTTHVGSHRFSANLLCFPHGIYYGRTSVEDCREIVRGYESGLISVESLRGRSCFSKPVQAAEYFLRSETGIHGIDDLKLVSENSVDEKATVRFSTNPDNSEFTVNLEMSHAIEILARCGDQEKKLVEQFSLLDINKNNSGL